MLQAFLQEHFTSRGARAAPVGVHIRIILINSRVSGFRRSAGGCRRSEQMDRHNHRDAAVMAVSVVYAADKHTDVCHIWSDTYIHTCVYI